MISTKGKRYAYVRMCNGKLHEMREGELHDSFFALRPELARNSNR